MRQFLEFIWIIIGPGIRFIVGGAAALLALTWVFTGFGILIIFAPESFPTPGWVRWGVILLDAFCIIIVTSGAVVEAYRKVYKS